MIKVTIWNENIQEQGDKRAEDAAETDKSQELRAEEIRVAKLMHEIHQTAIHDTIRRILEEDGEIEVCHIGTFDMPENGLTEEVLDETDVLIWWSHADNDGLPVKTAQRVQKYVLMGMGFIALHSACMCRPLRLLLGTGCTMKWRENDSGRLWTVAPNHRITQGIPEYINLECEEMYGEYFDIPTPDELIFISWYQGGEVFRSGCTWQRGMGKIFYFQPGHETNRSYFIPEVRQILRNAVHWACPIRKHVQYACAEHPKMN